MAMLEELELQGNFLFRNRGRLPLLLLPAGLGIFIYQEYVGHVNPPWLAHNIYPYICLIISLAGFAVRVYTVGFTPKNTSGRNTVTGQIADQLNTTGIYSIVRHPLYTGNFLMWLGIAMLAENAWFILTFILAFWIYYERIMFAEEQYLRRKFKEVFTDWAERTPAFIPSFKNYRPSPLSFSIKKVLKKEKNGLFAVFVLFFVFQYTEDILQTGSFAVVFDFWLYAFFLSGIFYVVFKILKRYTVLLDEADR